MKNFLIIVFVSILLTPFAFAETIKVYQKEASQVTYDKESGTITEQTSVESVDVEPILNNKFNGKKEKIKNKSGNSKDYIIAPDNSSESIKNSIRNAVRRINDPYVIKVNGVKYYMIKNSSDGQYSLDNVVGYGDKRNSLFASLISLNSDRDKTKLTDNELDMAGIRFVAVSPQGKLLLNNNYQDFKDVMYIDLSNLKESVNNGKIGSFGYFDVYIKNSYGEIKKIIGYVSFDSDEELLEMLK